MRALDWVCLFLDTLNAAGTVVKWVGGYVALWSRGFGSDGLRVFVHPECWFDCVCFPRVLVWC